MVKVALVKGDEGKANIRQALELVVEDIDLKGRRPVIKVNFVSSYNPLCATHPDAVRAGVELLKDRGEKDISVTRIKIHLKVGVTLTDKEMICSGNILRLIHRD